MARGKKASRVTTKPSIKLQGRKEIPVEFYIPSDVDSLYADGAFITFSNGTFILSFVQTRHPLILTDEDLAKVASVEGKCIARVAISPERMAVIIEVLQKHFVKIAERQKNADSSDKQG